MLLDKTARDLLSLEGQILQILMQGECAAGDIYTNVAASQPTVSKRLARMIDDGKIEFFPCPQDRRVSIYKIAHGYAAYLAREGFAPIRKAG